jgi:hypothetical protein
MSDNSYRFIYWDELDGETSETTKNKNYQPKTFSDSLEDED